MKIAIDLDDVISNSLTSFLEYFNKSQNYFDELKYQDFTSYNLHKIIPISQEEELKLFLEYDNSDYYLEIKPIEGAIEAINQLKQNHQLIIMTARPQNQEKQIRAWLKKNKINISEIFFIRKEYGAPSKTKGEYCKELNVDILIEDNIDYAKTCIENNIQVFLFDSPWNQEENLNELITRVKSWREILIHLT